MTPLPSPADERATFQHLNSKTFFKVTAYSLHQLVQKPPAQKQVAKHPIGNPQVKPLAMCSQLE